MTWLDDVGIPLMGINVGMVRDDNHSPVVAKCIVELPARHQAIIPTTSYPGSFHYAPRWRKDPGPGWSRVSQILGDNKLFAQGWGAKFVLPI